MEMKTYPHLNFKHSFASTQILVGVSIQVSALLSSHSA